MPKYYYTYGTDPAYPFQGGWTEIEAPDRSAADQAFIALHPYRNRALNCADIYWEEDFMKSALINGNFGAYCHERITLTREVLTPKDGRW